MNFMMVLIDSSIFGNISHIHTLLYFPTNEIITRKVFWQVKLHECGFITEAKILHVSTDLQWRVSYEFLFDITDYLFKNIHHPLWFGVISDDCWTIDLVPWTPISCIDLFGSYYHFIMAFN